jgi:succinate dehydrogenase (ubiquinone) cytochrome b560 subunit
MQATRAVGLGLRLGRSSLINRQAAPTFSRVLAAQNNLAPLRRYIQIQSLPPAAADDITNSQRVSRPSSPHFTIYQPQVTWVASIVNRVTGAALSTGMYGFFVAYALGPLVGLPFDSAAVIEMIQGLPEWFKLFIKADLAFAFSFHTWNGIRHLSWDTLCFLSLKGVYSSAYAVFAATALTTVGLLMW